MLQIEASLIDDSRGVIYDHNMFIVQATGLTHKYNTRQEVVARDKPSSLFSRVFSNKEKSFIAWTPEFIFADLVNF
jgi:hypothetical protein